MNKWTLKRTFSIVYITILYSSVDGHIYRVHHGCCEEWNATINVDKRYCLCPGLLAGRPRRPLGVEDEVVQTLWAVEKCSSKLSERVVSSFNTSRLCLIGPNKVFLIGWPCLYRQPLASQAVLNQVLLQEMVLWLRTSTTTTTCPPCLQRSGPAFPATMQLFLEYTTRILFESTGAKGSN